MQSHNGLPFRQRVGRTVALSVIALLIGLLLVASLAAERGASKFGPLGFLRQYTQPVAVATSFTQEYIKDPQEIKLLEALFALDPSDPDYEARSREINQKIDDLRSRRTVK
ncbi:MAG TPA: hypothetical protein VF826_13105 [Chloroflexia bacterium]|jgi:hypothetical protein